MKKILAALFLMVFVASCHENLEERAARDCAEETRRDCPRVMSPEMTMDSLVFEKDTRTMRCYSTVSGSLSEANPQVISQLRAMLLDALVKETGNKAYKDAGFNFRYTFISNKSKDNIVYDFTFTKKDYNR
ncbi:MAG: hypothetical protein K5893_10210 [Prevotella sp.]|nr:hypothetical protein [Prevotella sp.]